MWKGAVRQGAGYAEGFIAGRFSVWLYGVVYIG